MVMHDQTRRRHASTGRPDVHAFTSAPRRVGPLLAWFTCVSAALALLLWLGDGRLAAPDLTAPSTWGAWAEARSAAESAVAILRVLALGMAWYLVGITTVSVLAHALRAARLVRVADALSVGPVRIVVQQALGVSLATGVLLTTVPGIVGNGTSSPDHHAQSAATVTATAVESVTATLAGTPNEPPREPSTVTLVVGDSGVVDPTVPVDAAGVIPAPVPAPVPVPIPAPIPAEPVSPVARSQPAASESVPSEPVPSEPAVSDVDPVAPSGVDEAAPASALEAPGAEGRTVRVAAGDHLWGLAEADLEAHLAGPATEAQVLAHWERLVEANRDRLDVPNNPDMIRPGQLMLLPDVEVGL